MNSFKHSLCSTISCFDSSIHPKDEIFTWPDKCYHFCTRRSNDLEQGIVDLSCRSDPQKTPGKIRADLSLLQMILALLAAAAAPSIAPHVCLFNRRKKCRKNGESSAELRMHQNDITSIHFYNDAICIANIITYSLYLHVPPYELSTKKSGELCQF